MAKRSSRREFLKHAARAGVGFWVANNCGCSLLAPTPQPRRIGTNEKLNIAIVGAGELNYSFTLYVV